MRHLREFFDLRADLSDRGRSIVSPHWQAMWAAWGRGDRVLPITLSGYPGESGQQVRERRQMFETFVRWQLESGGIDQSILPEDWVNGQDATRHYDALSVEDLVAPKTFDRHPQLSIMASGGIDFVIALAWARTVLRYEPEDVAVVWVDYGTTLARKAEAVINRTHRWVTSRAIWAFRVNARPPGGKIIEVPQLPGGKKIYRNALLASIGSLLAPTVWVLAGSAQRPEHASRSTRFFADVSAVLSLQHDRPVQVNSPFRHISKVDLYRWFIDRFGDEAYQLFDATSDCDAKSVLVCGQCRACVRSRQMMLDVGDQRLTELCGKRYPEEQK